MKNTYIDLHCDTLLSALMDERDDIYEFPKTMLDIKRMVEAEMPAQFFAIFFPPKKDGVFEMIPNPKMSDMEFFDALYGIFKNTLDLHSDAIAFAKNGEELRNNESNGKASAFLTLEDGRIIEGDFDNLNYFYGKGVRLISLTWNGENCFGSPNSTDEKVMSRGLSDFGRQSISVMNEMGILIDVSHLSDGGFWDVAHLTNRPFIASHSNCRALSPHPRNLTDDMIKALAQSGGVMGLNFAPAFLDGEMRPERTTIAMLTEHLSHMVNVGGEDLPAMGTDFDGIGGNLEIDEPTKMHLLWDTLKHEGFSERLIDKIAMGNARRIIDDVL